MTFDESEFHQLADRYGGTVAVQATRDPAANYRLSLVRGKPPSPQQTA